MNNLISFNTFPVKSKCKKANTYLYINEIYCKFAIIISFNNKIKNT